MPELRQGSGGCDSKSHFTLSDLAHGIANVPCCSINFLSRMETYSAADKLLRGDAQYDTRRKTAISKVRKNYFIKLIADNSCLVIMTLFIHLIRIMVHLPHKLTSC